MFHPLIDAWFARRFKAPTPVQARAWPVIEGGRDCLVAAPTGSGKTLAAFLWCLDRLVRQGDAGELPSRVDVVYVSPLKALSNDVQKNLDEPIAELGELAAELGHARPRIRTAVRTGDTSMRDRRLLAKTPPHVLVTTPESLYILLGSASGRRALEAVRVVIIDEVHALASDKRGAHLALSVERLEDLVTRGGRPRPQRIGLSATMRPIEVAARMLVGARRPMPEIVDTGLRRDLDLAVEVPKDELGAVCTNEQWAELYDRLADEIRAHRSTLVFVNTRRLVERLAMHLGERLGEDAVAAHHGSLSRTRRLSAERRLKAGELKVVVATASLELGIDVGAVELACLVGSPRSIATALQRIGRSGHALSATPKGRFFPLTRDQLVECAAIVRAARRGEIDKLCMRDAPLDILAQQIVAACAEGERDETELFDLFVRAAPYEHLERASWDDTTKMLVEGVSARRGRAGALLFRDAVGGRIKARRGAGLVALTSGGAIPDNGNYDVVLADGAKIGSVDEDFAIDSSAGDVFVLGATSWKIRRIEAGKVWVEDAHGAPPSVPFWFGEGPARSMELSAEVAALREEIVQKLFDDGRAPQGEAKLHATVAWLEATCALDRAGAVLLCEYVAAARAALGEVPTQKVVIAERFFDEAGGMQLVIHAPFGGRINRAWGMALRKRFCRSFDFELQAAATDDGVLLSLGAQHSFPLEVIFEMLRPEGVTAVLEQAALQAPMFGTRFRWNATRSLQLLRFSNGRKVPAPLVRMRSDDLIAAVFPAQLGCQDNHGREAILEIPDHPLVRETLRDCLTEVMDAAGLSDVLERIRRGEIRIVARETAEPSVFSHEILNANPYAFLDDAPLEERRARAVRVRRGLPAEIADRLGGLDPDAITSVVAEAAPVVRDADELHDLLLDLFALPEAEGLARGYHALFASLVSARRASRLVGGELDAPRWVSAERRAVAAMIWPTATFVPELALLASSDTPADREDAIARLVRGRLALMGPVTAARLAAILGVDLSDVDIALVRVENDGIVLRGRFSPELPPGELEWCDRRLLARIHRRTVDGLRRAIEPAAPADLVRFLLSWHGVLPGKRAQGAAGLARVVEQLQGFDVAAGAWEADILPLRVEGYEHTWLDLLCLSGEVAWGRLAPRASAAGAPTRAAPISLVLRKDLPWLLSGLEPAAAGGTDDEGLSDPARRVLASLGSVGASFFDEIVRATSLGRAEVEEALWELVSAGRITGDGFAGLRSLLGADARNRMSAKRFSRSAPVLAAGRWALLRALRVADVEGEGAADPIEAFARQLLRRWGIVLRELAVREARAPAWRDLVRVFRRLEMRGEIRGGRLVAGFVGEQFALPEALLALRAIRNEKPSGVVVKLSACDPLNLVGVLVPGARVASTMGSEVLVGDDGFFLPNPIEPSLTNTPPERAPAPI